MALRIESRAIIRLAKFFTPIVLGFGVYTIWGMLSDELSKIWPLLIAYFFPPFGKETVIPLGIGILEKGLTVPLLNIKVNPVSVNPIAVALAVAFIDIVVALFLVWNYDLAKKIPFVGKFITKVEEKGKNVEKKYNWIIPLRFIGIVLFVMIPFQGSGGLVGSIVGRLIGMKPWNIFFAIVIGAIIGCLLIATFAKAFLVFAEINTLLTLILVGVIIVVIVVYWFPKKRKKQPNQSSTG
ncbi:MAG: small multi-drug export protein [Petrotogales bacterium]